MAGGRGGHKKQMADEREETGHSYGTNSDRFGLSASKGYKNTYGTESTHCHASSVEANSQNIGTATALHTGQLQPRHCTQASYSPTLSLQPRARRALLQFNLSRLQPHTETRTEDFDVNGSVPNSHEDGQITRHTTRTLGSAHKGEPADASTPRRAFFFFSNHSAARKSLSYF